MFVHTSQVKFATVIAAASLLGMTNAAAAATPCGSHDKVAQLLTTKHQEARRIMGIVSAHAVMEIFMSPKGTWTVLVTDTNGTACIIASGEDWQEVPIAMAGLDS